MMLLSRISVLLLILQVLEYSSILTTAFCPQQQQKSSSSRCRSSPVLLLQRWSTTTTTAISSTTRVGAVSVNNQPTSTDLDNNTDTTPEEDDDDEYEYIEYDRLTEAEFINSEWLVGTNYDNAPNTIQETWVRLIVDKNGKNVAIWGDNALGSWNLDVASQYLGISKENTFTGKVIWAATVQDYYYCSGTVRGWRFWSAACILGQWQAKRLGVDKDEAGVAPWFEQQQQQEQSIDTTTPDVDADAPKVQVVEAKAMEAPSDNDKESTNAKTTTATTNKETKEESQA